MTDVDDIDDLYEDDDPADYYDPPEPDEPDYYCWDCRDRGVDHDGARCRTCRPLGREHKRIAHRNWQHMDRATRPRPSCLPSWDDGPPF